VSPEGNTPADARHDRRQVHVPLNEGASPVLALAKRCAHGGAWVVLPELPYESVSLCCQVVGLDAQAIGHEAGHKVERFAVTAGQFEYVGMRIPCRLDWLFQFDFLDIARILPVGIAVLLDGNDCRASAVVLQPGQSYDEHHAAQPSAGLAQVNRSILDLFEPLSGSRYRRGCCDILLGLVLQSQMDTGDRLPLRPRLGLRGLAYARDPDRVDLSLRREGFRGIIRHRATPLRSFVGPPGCRMLPGRSDHLTAGQWGASRSLTSSGLPARATSGAVPARRDAMRGKWGDNRQSTRMPQGYGEARRLKPSVPSVESGLAPVPASQRTGEPFGVLSDIGRRRYLGRCSVSRHRHTTLGSPSCGAQNAQIRKAPGSFCGDLGGALDGNAQQVRDRSQGGIATSQPLELLLHGSSCIDKHGDCQVSHVGSPLRESRDDSPPSLQAERESLRQYCDRGRLARSTGGRWDQSRRYRFQDEENRIRNGYAVLDGVILEQLVNQIVKQIVEQLSDRLTGELDRRDLLNRADLALEGEEGPDAVNDGRSQDPSGAERSLDPAKHGDLLVVDSLRARAGAAVYWPSLPRIAPNVRRRTSCAARPLGGTIGAPGGSGKRRGPGDAPHRPGWPIRPTWPPGHPRGAAR
jgi:hypothetical protein